LSDKGPGSFWAGKPRKPPLRAAIRFERPNASREVVLESESLGGFGAALPNARDIDRRDLVSVARADPP
jgi:hypothetical protein